MNDFDDDKWKTLKFVSKLSESFKEVLKEKCSPQQSVNQNMDWDYPSIVDAQMTVE
jgi:hypothetical protein